MGVFAYIKNGVKYKTNQFPGAYPANRVSYNGSDVKTALDELNADKADNDKITPIIKTAILSGTLGNDVNIPAYISYPTGWTKSDTFVIGVQVRYSSSDIWYLTDEAIQVLTDSGYIKVYTKNSAFCNSSVRVLAMRCSV